MNSVHLVTQENTESNWAKNRSSAPSARPKASPRAQAARLPRSAARLSPALRVRVLPVPARPCRPRLLPVACAPRARVSARVPACAPQRLPTCTPRLLPCACLRAQPSAPRTPSAQPSAPRTPKAQPRAQRPPAPSYAPSPVPACRVAATVVVSWLEWALYCNTVQPCLALFSQYSSIVLQHKLS